MGRAVVSLSLSQHKESKEMTDCVLKQSVELMIYFPSS